MGIDINKATVILLPDESGNEHFKDFYTRLAELGNHSHNEKVKLSFIRAVLSRLGTLDKSELPQNSDTQLSFDFEIEVDGKTYTEHLEIVKKLSKSVIYELRIDIPDFNWWFRATFFPKYHQSELYYCMVYPFEKVPGYEDPTNRYRDLTHEVFVDTRDNPEKYFE